MMRGREWRKKQGHVDVHKQRNAVQILTLHLLSHLSHFLCPSSPPSFLPFFLPLPFPPSYSFLSLPPSFPSPSPRLSFVSPLSLSRSMHENVLKTLPTLPSSPCMLSYITSSLQELHYSSYRGFTLIMNYIRKYLHILSVGLPTADTVCISPT